jgi:hypothetical protein
MNPRPLASSSVVSLVLDTTLQLGGLHAAGQPGTHRTWERWATGEEMKALLILVLLMVAAATAVAFANATVATSVAAAAVHVADHTSEPAALLVSGSLLLVLAGAVRRLTL